MVRSHAPAAVALLLAAAALGHAHEIKVLASQLAAENPGGKTTVYLSWGHRLPVDDLIDAASIERYDLISPGGTATPLAKAGQSLQANVVELKDVGVYQVLVGRKPSIFTYVFDADGNRVLKRGPKTLVKEGKVDSGTHSRQCAKALIVVGTPGTEAVRPAGIAIEIVPQEGPAGWTSRAPLHFQVLLEGKPLAFAELTARYVGHKPDNAWCYATTANRDGVATVLPGQAGTWVLKVSTKRLTNGSLREQYDFESFTATLALEIRP